MAELRCDATQQKQGTFSKYTGGSPNIIPSRLLSITFIRVIMTALLSILLTPVLVQTAEKNATQARLVIVTSDTHYMTSFSDKVVSSPNFFDKLNEKQYFDGVGGETRYFESKR